MMTYEVLEKALALIEDEKNWCGKGWGFTTAEGRCGLHAIEDAKEGFDEAPQEVVNDLARDKGSGWFGDFNDSHTHAEVVALFQEAIRSEKAKEGIALDVETPAEVPA